MKGNYVLASTPNLPPSEEDSGDTPRPGKGLRPLHPCFIS